MLSMMFSSGIALGVALNYKLWEITTLCWGQQLQSGEILDHSPPPSIFSIHLPMFLYGKISKGCKSGFVFEEIA